jgi:predicted DNA-binding helix-hairpin-helix protein
MFYNWFMDQLEKIRILSENKDVEEDGPGRFSFSQCGLKPNEETLPDVSYARLPGGGTIPLLKTMVSSICEKNCNYCAFRSGRDIPRAIFQPDELANTFLELANKKIVQGLFLSSGILGKGIISQDKIIETAEIIRKKKKFRGYMHLKVMPGAEKDQIRELMKYADRVSINLEAPNPERLETLAPKKDFFNELFTRMKWIHEIRATEDAHASWKNKWPSISTQFVVGPAQENDRELVSASAYLIEKFRLARVYFSAFSPIMNTPFENIPAESQLREHRLYQASYLLRDYGFQNEDFYFEDSGNLSLELDPKMTWAERNLLIEPLEINKATREQLLRVPGIGPKKADLILHYRRGKNSIHTLEDLKGLGVSYAKSGRYILVNGKSFGFQPRLFP